LPAKREINAIQTVYPDSQIEKAEAKEQAEESEGHQYTTQRFRTYAATRPTWVPHAKGEDATFPLLPLTPTHETNEQRSGGHQETYRLRKEDEVGEGR
jgi:hypothetical protein